MNSLLIDFLPLLAFYAALWLGGIYAATAAGIAASVASIAWMLARGHSVRPMAWISSGLIVVLGSATLILHDDTFIKWKPTVLYWLFSSVLLLAPRLAGKNPIRLLISSELRLPEGVWAWVNDSWAIFFALLGGLNLYIAYHFSVTTWATFKVFGTLILMTVFVVAQGVVLARYVQDGDGPAP